MRIHVYLYICTHMYARRIVTRKWRGRKEGDKNATGDQ